MDSNQLKSECMNSTSKIPGIPNPAVQLFLGMHLETADLFVHTSRNSSMARFRKAEISKTLSMDENFSRFVSDSKDVSITCTKKLGAVRWASVIRSYLMFCQKYCLIHIKIHTNNLKIHVDQVNLTTLIGYIRPPPLLTQNLLQLYIFFHIPFSLHLMLQCTHLVMIKLERSRINIVNYYKLQSEHDKIIKQHVIAR